MRSPPRPDRRPPWLKSDPIDVPASAFLDGVAHALAAGYYCETGVVTVPLAFCPSPSAVYTVTRALSREMPPGEQGDVFLAIDRDVVFETHSLPRQAYED